MGFEIPLDNDYPEHPKTLDLKSRIGAQADAFPIRLWCWASKYARDGTIKINAQTLERALGWTGTRLRLHKALVASGFIKRDGKTIHDWDKRTGRAIMYYDEKKERQRRKYAERIGILPEENRKDSVDPVNPVDPGDPVNPGGEKNPALTRVLKAIIKAGIPGHWRKKDDYARAMLMRHGVDEAVRILGLPESQGIACIELEDRWLRGASSESLKDYRKRKAGAGK